MKIIKPNAIELKQTDLLKHIELCGRTCYKSEDKITDGSAEKFVNMLRSHAHGAMLEHGTVYLIIPADKVKDWAAEHYVEYGKLACETWLKFIRELPYSKCLKTLDNYYITTNYRVIAENDLEDLIDLFGSVCTEHHPKRRTFKITCNRGVSHEFVRHRVFSFAQESQRYCNYSKDKYGKEITFIEPIWQNVLDINKVDNSLMRYEWEDAMKTAERSYFYLLECGLTPQLARGVLPNDTKTELIMTGFESDWEHFFELRCANDAHPEAKYIADMIKEQF